MAIYQIHTYVLRSLIDISTFFLAGLFLHVVGGAIVLKSFLYLKYLGI